MTKGDKVDGKKGNIMGAKGKLEAYWLKMVNQMIKRDIYKELYGTRVKHNFTAGKIKWNNSSGLHNIKEIIEALMKDDRKS